MPRYVLRFHEIGTGVSERRFEARDDPSAWSHLVDAEAAPHGEGHYPIGAQIIVLKSRTDFELLRVVEQPHAHEP